jgi:hypothetical protein
MLREQNVSSFGNGNRSYKAILFDVGVGFWDNGEVRLSCFISSVFTESAVAHDCNIHAVPSGEQYQLSFLSGRFYSSRAIARFLVQNSRNTI